VAGVKSVVIASPAGKDGLPGQQVLAAVAVAGADAVIGLGGAQAIAAFAFGTASVAKVDKIFGPGGIFVTIAKKKVYGTVGIDGVYGPTETLVIADESANPALCAADLLAQAEHDVLATPVLLATSQAVLSPVVDELEKQLSGLERRDIARASLEGRGVFAVVGSIEEAIDIANEFAPEHLCLLVKRPELYQDLVTNAGGLFLGEGSPEVLGDYVAGPSHTMPTGGTARFSSALGVLDFLKISSVIGLGAEEAASLAPAAAEIARAEGLTGHARAAEIRAKKRAGVKRS
jgi:histidinol dehydrogenase